MEDKNLKTDKKKETVVNPLRKEKVKVEFVPQKTGLSPENPRHVMHGGVMAGATTTLGVPTLRTTGSYKNVLTDSEKAFFEETLGMEKNALSVYNKTNNFWDDYYITIDTKTGLTLDLSDPEDYIRYKVLLANSDIVAPSRKELQDRPLGTYRFVMTRESEKSSMEAAKTDATLECFRKFEKIKDDIDTMRVLVELIETRPYAQNTKADFFRNRIIELIHSNPKGTLEQFNDPMLHTKVVIRRAVEIGKLSKRGDYYYLKADNTPLCESGETPTLSIAARFLNTPAHQDVKFLLESEVEKARKD